LTAIDGGNSCLFRRNVLLRDTDLAGLFAEYFGPRTGLMATV
jgi:hypothetical protein